MKNKNKEEKSPLSLIAMKNDDKDEKVKLNLKDMTLEFINPAIPSLIILVLLLAFIVVLLRFSPDLKFRED